MSCVFVGGDGRGFCLGMAHFLKRDAVRERAFAAVVQGACFSFGCGGHDVLDDRGEDVNGAVVESVVAFARHVIVRSSATFRIDFGEI